MTTSAMTTLIRQLRSSVLAGDGAGLTDGQLLTCFIEQHEEAAFAALARRHGPMVWGVCRRLLRNHHDAEDAFQATFLVLVRKAASVLPREMVANWLYGVAMKTAHRAKVATAKRRAKERQVRDMPEPEAVRQELWHDLQPLLDQELSRLPDNYRVVILQCDLEGKTRKEVARQLGCPEGTVAGRLARARTMLAKRLTRAGFALSAGSLAAALSQHAASAWVPASLVSSTIKAASLVAAGQAATGVISAQVAALTEGVLRMNLLGDLKGATAVLLAVAVASLGAGGLIYRTQAPGPGEARAAAEPTADPDKQARGPTTNGKKELEKLQGTWIGVSVFNHPVSRKPVKVKPMKVKLMITGDRFTAMPLTSGKVSVRGKIKLDPTKQPKRFDLTDFRFYTGKVDDAKARALDPKGGEAQGIYELVGDTLKVCYASDRPTEFKARGHPWQELFIFKREIAVKQPKESPR